MLQPLPLGVGSAWHSLSAAGSQLLLFGGVRGPQQYSNQLLLFDPVANLWTPVATTGGAVPAARAAHAAYWDGSSLWVFGGVGVGGALLSDVWQFTLSTGAWQQRNPSNAGNAPSARYLHAAVPGPTAGVVCLFGGLNVASNALVTTANVPATLYCLDTAAMAWQTPINAPGNVPAVYGNAGLASAGGWVSLGGVTTSQGQVWGGAISFTWATAQWQVGTAATGPLAFAAAAPSPGGFAWLFGGVSAAGQLNRAAMAVPLSLSVAAAVPVAQVCEPGYSGPAPSCPTPVCQFNCWGLGTCIAPDLCECQFGFSGPLCSGTPCASCGSQWLALNARIYYPRARQKALQCATTLRAQINAILALLPPYPQTCGSNVTANGSSLSLNLTAVSKAAWDFATGSAPAVAATTAQTLARL